MRVFALAIICMLLSLPASAQIVSPDVFVTTQDYSSLRNGPGERFERMVVLPPATTLRAVGRTANMTWVQVEYEGQRGWIAAWLLVWSGDMISLPIDGVDPDPFIRRAYVTAVSTRETPLYELTEYGPRRIGMMPIETEVEVTGRMGSGRRFWLQISYQGQLYWVGTWDMILTDGSYEQVLNTSYLYPYGRLTVRLRIDINRSLRSLTTIESTWARLAEAQSVSCDNLPPYAVRTAVDNDVEREQIFAPVVTALDSAIQEINLAISTFADACARPDEEEQVTEQGVRTTLASLGSARRSLTLSAALMNSLSNRNPILNDN